MAWGALFVTAWGLVTLSATAGQWTITQRNALSLSTASVPGVFELSGVTYLGPAAGGLARFAAIQDDGNQIVQFDVDFSANASLVSATAVSGLHLNAPNLDYEGIAYTGPARGTVFISEEESPGVREFSLATGNQLQSVSIPNVFSNIRDNRGFESLARSQDGTTMCTANEEALSVDGPASNESHGTYVRLLELTDSGTSVAAGPQYAYLVDPVHASNPDRSGLADMVMLPDNTLITLERSRANAIPPYESRIYQVDFAGATDVSTATYNSGLAGKSFTTVDKTLLWSGQAVNFLGENLEGLALGPPLPGGGWALLGVIDNGGSGTNPIVSFELNYSGCELAGDYNCNGAVGGEDFLVWRGSFGLVGELPADGNGDGLVDAADYTVWRDHLGDVIGTGAAAGSSSSLELAVPEPGAACLFLLGAILASRGAGTVAQQRSAHGLR